jgi:hypothetical protein
LKTNWGLGNEKWYENQSAFRKGNMVCKTISFPPATEIKRGPELTKKATKEGKINMVFL